MIMTKMKLSKNVLCLLTMLLMYLTDTEEVIQTRLAKAEYELTFASQFDRIIVNDDLETAKAELLTVVDSFLK